MPTKRRWTENDLHLNGSGPVEEARFLAKTMTIEAVVVTSNGKSWQG